MSYSQAFISGDKLAEFRNRASQCSDAGFGRYVSFYGEWAVARAVTLYSGKLTPAVIDTTIASCEDKDFIRDQRQQVTDYLMGVFTELTKPASVRTAQKPSDPMGLNA